MVRVLTHNVTVTTAGVAKDAPCRTKMNVNTGELLRDEVHEMFLMTLNIFLADLVMFLHTAPTTSGATSVLASQDTKGMVTVVKVG